MSLPILNSVFSVSSSDIILNQGIKAAATDCPAGFYRTLWKNSWFCLYCTTHECLYLANAGNVLSEREEFARKLGTSVLCFRAPLFFILSIRWQGKLNVSSWWNNRFPKCVHLARKRHIFVSALASVPQGDWLASKLPIKEVTSWVSCCWALLFVLKALICLLSQEVFPWKLFHLEAYFIHSNVSCGRRQKSICAVSCPFCKTALIWVSAFPSSWPYSVCRLPHSWAFCNI